MLCPPGLYIRCGTHRKNNSPECLPSIPTKGKPHYAAVAIWHRQNSEILSLPDSLLQNSTPEGAMYDARLAEGQHDLVGGMFEMELAKMFGGYGFLMNGHMCVFIWGDRLMIRIGEDAAMRLPTSRMSARWI